MTQMQKVKTLLERIPAWCRGAVVANLVATLLVVLIALIHWLVLYLKFPYPLTASDTLYSLFAAIGLYGVVLSWIWILALIALTPIFCLFLFKKSQTKVVKLILVNTAVSIPLGFVSLACYLVVYLTVGVGVIQIIKLIFG